MLHFHGMAQRPWDGLAGVELLKVQARWRDADRQIAMVEALLRLPVVEQSSWDALPLEEAVVSAVLLEQAARRHEAIRSMTLSQPNSDRGRFAQMLGSRHATISKEAKTQV